MDTVNGITYRALRAHELLEFARVESRGFGNLYRIREGYLERDKQYDGVARANVAVADDVGIVGTIGAVNLEVGIPGKVVPLSGVTEVSVAATHRRRGVLTEMMRCTLQEEAQLGFMLAGLWASESAIYGRFGYGAAVEQQDVLVDPQRSRFRRSAQQQVVEDAVRFAEPREIQELGPMLWRKMMEQTPGMCTRPQPEWPRAYPEKQSDEPENKFQIVYREAGEPLGFASYLRRPYKGDDGWDYMMIKVLEVISLTPSAEVSLWRFLLDIDLMKRVQHESHPLRSNLWHMLEDPRCMSQTPYDALWLRVLDVPRALAARTYLASGTVCIAVQDEFCPWVAGRYELRVSSDGKAECERTERATDVVMPAATLGAIYMGAHDLRALHAANRCEEVSPGAVALVERMFSSPQVQQVVAEF